MKYLPAIAILLLCSSCVTWNKCAKKFGTGDTVYVAYRDTIPVPVEVPVPGDTVTGSFNCDSLMAHLDTLTHTSDSGRVAVRFWADKYNNLLNYMATATPDTVEVEVKVPVEVQVPCPDAVVVDPERGLRWYERAWKGFQLFSAYLVLAGLLWTLLFFVLRRR